MAHESRQQRALLANAAVKTVVTYISLNACAGFTLNG